MGAHLKTKNPDLWRFTKRRRRITRQEYELANQIWATVLLPIGSEERRLIGALIAHPRAWITDAQVHAMGQLLQRLIPRRGKNDD